MLQTISSAKTSIKQVPAIYKKVDIKRCDAILDYGCGKYDLAKEYVESFGAKYYGYDKYNRTEEENERALSCNPTMIICANVLNVIKEDEVIHEILEEMKSYKVDVLISVYEGNKSNEGKETTKGYQRNQKAIEYESILEQHFEVVRRYGNIFQCFDLEILQH